MSVQQAVSECVVFEAVFDHGQIDGTCAVRVASNKLNRQFEWCSCGEIYMSEIAETIAERIVEFVQHVRATSRLTDGVYRSPAGPYGLRRQWLGIEWLASILEKQLRTGGYIDLHSNNPGWGRFSPWPRGREFSEHEHWEEFKFMPHMHRSATRADPDEPDATGLAAPVGGFPTTGEGSRRFNVVMSLILDCPIRGTGISVKELERLDAMVIELKRDLATVDESVPDHFISREEAADIVECSEKTISRRIKDGSLTGYDKGQLVSEAEVKSKKDVLLKRKPRTTASKS